MRKPCAWGEGPKPFERKRKKRKKIGRRVFSVIPRVSARGSGSEIGMPRVSWVHQISERDPSASQPIVQMIQSIRGVGTHRSKEFDQHQPSKGWNHELAFVRSQSDGSFVWMIHRGQTLVWLQCDDQSFPTVIRLWWSTTRKRWCVLNTVQ